MQWKDLERITKENEIKKSLIVHIYHNPEDYPCFTLCEEKTVEKGRVYLGPYSSWDKKDDMTYKARCEKLEKKLESMQNELWVVKNKLMKIEELAGY